ncbi:MAG TPA: TonB-dependent receptor [Chitinophagales bacterium]|nr:TonB-dependent receptor [Chitinophagales bacterium]
MNRLLILFIAALSPFFVFAQAIIPTDTITPNVIGDTVLQEFNEEIPTISISESDGKEDGGDNVSSSLNASRDAFYNTASFVFGVARFKIRGYETENYTTYLNGVPVNDLEDGNTVWAQWGGLNTMFYNRENSLGLQANTFAYGGVGGSFSFDVRASKQRKQFQVSYAATNRNYRHRVMASYSTGILKGGWAVAAAVSRRWAKEGYVEGTFYDGYSYFLSVEKLFGNNHSLSFTSFGAPTRSGTSTATTQEMYDLAQNHYYNPNWGWQDGKKRNGVVNSTHQPMMILSHDWKINNRSSLVTSAGFTFGKRGRTFIESNNSAPTRPDYYRYLPSYQEDSTQRALVSYEFLTNEDVRQLDWDGFYEANYTAYDSVIDANGQAGNVVRGNRARYFISNQIEDARKFNLASTYNNAVTEHIAITAGLTYQFERTRNYKVVDDLLGADFWVDINMFAQRDFPDSFSVAQNDLNNPNRILGVGDKFGYDYFITTHKAGVWGQSFFKYNKVDFFVAGQASITSFWREGKTRYGLQPTNSFGKSATKTLPNGGVKAGITYKIDGRNYIFLNGAFENRAPFPDDAFISPRTQNSISPNVKGENIFSAEIGYNFRSPNVKLKFDMFFTQFNNQTRTYRFYHDDLRSFVNYTLTGMNSRHWGAELGLEAKIYKGFSATVVGSLGRYTYTNRPEALITYDNDPNYKGIETVYQKNFNVGGTPQLATSLGINYRSPQFWFASVNFNYFDWMWLAHNPARRTESAVDLVETGTEKFDKIVNQERLKGQFTMNLSVGYSWMLNNQFKKLKRRYFLVFNASVTNITNNKNLVTGGYEQLRYDYFQKNADKFPSRYFYAYGASYFVSVAFRMQ